MENSTFKGLEDFAKQTAGFLGSLNLQISEYKKMLSPEQLAEFENQIKSNDLEKLNSDLERETQKLNELINRL